MTTVLTLNLDGSFQEVQPLAVSLGIASAGQLVRLNSFGQFDESVIPPIPVSLINALGTPDNSTFLRGDGSWVEVSSGGASQITTKGDLIIGDSGGLPVRLAIGIDNQVLTSFSGTATWKTLVSPSYSQTIGDGTTATIPINHNLGTKDLTISLVETTFPFRKVDSLLEIQYTSANIVTLAFTYPPLLNSYRVTLIAGTGALIPVSSITAGGTPSSTTFLRGDGVWATPTGGGGGTATTVTFVTGNHTLSTIESVILVNSSSPCIATLPTGVDNTLFTIRNVGTGTVVVMPNGTDTVENFSSFVLLPTNAINIIYYSGNWYLI